MVWTLPSAYLCTGKETARYTENRYRNDPNGTLPPHSMEKQVTQEKGIHRIPETNYWKKGKGKILKNIRGICG